MNLVLKINSTVKNILNLSFILSGFYALAQNDTLKNQVDVIKDYIPSVKDSYKINTDPSEKDTVMVPKIPVTYNADVLHLNPQFDNTIETPDSYLNPTNTEVYKGYVKLGVNTFARPYLLGGVGFSPNATTTFGIKANYNGFNQNNFKTSIGKHSTSGSNLGINAFGRKLFASNEFIGNVYYKYNEIHNNGDILQGNTNLSLFQDLNLSHLIGAKVNLLNTNSVSNSNFKYNFGAGFYYLTPKHYQSNEFNFKLEGQTAFNYKQHALKLGTYLDLYSNKRQNDALPNTNNSQAIWALKPAINLNGNCWSLQAGVNIFLQIGANGKFYLLPEALAKYSLIDKKLEAFAGISSNLKRNSSLALYETNPYLREDNTTKNTVTPFKLFVGLKGNVLNKFNYSISGSFTKLTNAIFFERKDSIPSYASFSSFSVNYENPIRLALEGDCYYTNTVYTVGASFMFQTYSNIKTQLKPWHTPNIKINIYSQYNITPKIALKIDAFYVGSQFVRYWDVTKYREKSISGIFDLNLEGEYKINTKFAAFLRLNNVLNTKYQVYNSYFNPGFSATLGITYKF